MKLTKYMREAFVRAAMADVPKVDYSEQQQKIAREAAIAMMPDDMRRAYKKTPHMFVLAEHWYSSFRCYFHLPIPRSEKLPDAVVAQLQELQDKSDAQNENRKELERKLQSVALACSTRKSLADALPEFVKYLPADEPQACRSLPVVANVVSDFVAAGWPKDAKKLKSVK